jgi:phage tail tape-measure protein
VQPTNVNEALLHSSKWQRRDWVMSIQLKAIKKLNGIAAVAVLSGSLLAGCAAGSLTTREKGAGIGALGGAAAGGLIGSAVRHPGAGAAIGAALGLGAGAVIGDQLQGRENQAYEQDQQINRNQQEINRQREQLEQIRRRDNEYY